MNTINEAMGTFRNWWTYEFLGVLLILMSLMVFSFPLSSYAALVIYFAISFILSGIMRTTFTLSNKTGLQHWRWYLAGGVFDIFIGAYLLFRLDVTSLVLPYFAGFYLLMGSIAAIAKAIDLRNMGIKSYGWMLSSGILTLILSGLIIFNPAIGIVTITVTTALGFAMLGIFYIILGIRLQKLQTTFRPILRRS